MEGRASQAPLSNYKEWLYIHVKSVNNYGRQRCLILWQSKTKKIPAKNHHVQTSLSANHPTFFTQEYSSQEGIWKASSKR